MKRKIVMLLLALSIATTSITACGNKVETETTETETTETEAVAKIESLPWLVLGELETVPELRAQFDEFFGITGETGNKVGPIYYNTDTEQADQNVTLFMVLKNTDTRGHFIAVDSRDTIANMAIEYYSMDIGDQAATYAAINAYFNLLPDEALKECEEPTFDNGKISRAAAMALLMRATTQVNDSQTPDTNSVFTSAVGSGQFTDFAAPMNVFAYYHTDLSKETGSTTNLMTKEDFDAYVKANKGEAVLNEDLFNTSMTKGEFIYMVTNYLLADYQAKLDEEGFVDIYENAPDVELTTVTDGGDITLEDAMAGAANDASTGIPSDMYAVFKQAVKYNLISEDAFAEWNATVSKSDAVDLFTTMVLNYTEESAYGLYNDGYQSPEELSEKEAISEENKSLTKFAESLPGEGTLQQKFQDWARSQGADYALGWTFVYKNGSGAGDQPTYGVYMKEGSRYGEIFNVGDILPNGSRLDGTREEEDAISTQNAKEKVEEAGGKVYIDEETGKEVWEIP